MLACCVPKPSQLCGCVSKCQCMYVCMRVCSNADYRIPFNSKCVSTRWRAVFA